jgi:hypothetical protein
MPEGIHDRNADIWEPLLAVADAVGGDWPERARVTAVTLVMLSRERETSLCLRLLSDLRSIFGNADTHSTVSLLDALLNLNESPWEILEGGHSTIAGWRLAFVITKSNRRSSVLVTLPPEDMPVRILETLGRGIFHALRQEA